MTLEKRGRYTYIAIGSEKIKCASAKAGKQLVKALSGWTPRAPLTAAAQAPAIVKAAPEIEQVARYLVRGFHDWDAERNWPPSITTWSRECAPCTTTFMRRPARP